MSGMPVTEWGTDYWGEVMSEPSEERARSVARAGGANVYSRAPMGAWLKEEVEAMIRDRSDDVAEFASAIREAASRDAFSIGEITSLSVASWLLHAGYRAPARVVTTEEDLDTLPEGTVVMTHTPWLRARSAHGRLVWGCVGDTEIYGADIVMADTVATVLHEPKIRGEA